MISVRTPPQNAECGDRCPRIFLLSMQLYQTVYHQIRRSLSDIRYRRVFARASTSSRVGITRSAPLRVVMMDAAAFA